MCDKLKKNEDTICCWKMDAVVDHDENIEYTYKINIGVSNIQGAIKVLKDMEYPCEIIDNIMNWE